MNIALLRTLADLCPRPSLAAIASLAFVATAFGQTPGKSAPPDIVELPAIEVVGARDLPKQESWRYIEFGGFEVLSNSSDKETKALLREMLMFQQALSYIWPVPTKRATSSTLILCGRGGKFDAFIPADSEMTGAAIASLFLSNHAHRAIVLDLQARDISLTDDDGQIKQFVVEANQQLYREYVKFLFSQSDSRVPAWLEEGLAQIIMAMEITEKHVTFGFIDSSKHPSQVVGGNAGVMEDEEEEAATEEADTTVANRPFNVALRGRGIVPFERFFAVTHDSATARNAIGNNIWGKQAYAFVHLCLYGQKGKYQKSFGQLLKRLGTEPMSEALFQECFGLTYKQMQLRLRGYANATTFEYTRLVSKDGARLGGEVPDLRDATQAEIGRIKGETFLLAGKPTDAHGEFTTAYRRGERDPRLLSALGLAEVRAGQIERGRKFLEAAAAAKVVHPAAYIELARQRLAVAKAEPGTDGQLSSAQLVSVLDPLFIARKQPPSWPDTYELIAEAWLHSATAPKLENTAILEEGVRLFPRNSRLILQAAQLNAKHGFIPQATALATFGARNAAEPAMKKRFDEILAALPPPAPKPAP